MWRGESCANGCLSGWNSLPGTQETGKQKTPKNEQLTLLDWQSGKNLGKTKKNDSWRGTGEKLGRWHGVKLFVFLIFAFFHGFWCILGPRWQKPRENQKKNEGPRRNWTDDMGWNFFFFVCLVFPGVLGHSWAKVADTLRKSKNTTTKNSTHGEGLRRSWTGDVGWCFFLLVVPWFGPIFSSFRIWIVCLRVWDRSKLQEWKQISKQDEFKQTMQNMPVSTMCTPSPPIILPSGFSIAKSIRFPFIFKWKYCRKLDLEAFP